MWTKALAEREGAADWVERAKGVEPLAVRVVACVCVCVCVCFCASVRACVSAGPRAPRAKEKYQFLVELNVCLFCVAWRRSCCPALSETAVRLPCRGCCLRFVSEEGPRPAKKRRGCLAGCVWSVVARTTLVDAHILFTHTNMHARSKGMLLFDDVCILSIAF